MEEWSIWPTKLLSKRLSEKLPWPLQEKKKATQELLLETKINNKAGENEHRE